MTGHWGFYFSFRALADTICYSPDGIFWWILPDQTVDIWNKLVAGPHGREWNALVWTRTFTTVTTWADVTDPITPVKGSIGAPPTAFDESFTV